MGSCGLDFFFILDLDPVPRFPPPGSPAASVAYCTIPRFLNVPTLAARCLSRPKPAVVPLVARGGTMGEKWWPNGAWDMRHGTDNFTSLPKEGVLRIFIAL